MRLYITILLLILTLSSVAQNSNCRDNFFSIKKYIESNSASFSDNVNKENGERYNNFCANIVKQIPANCENCNCITFIETYLKYFKDNHLSISKKTKQFNENDSTDLNDFFKSENFLETEKIVLDSSYLQNLYLKNTKEIEGIYIENGSDYYKVAVVKINNSNNYKGVIIDSKTQCWKKGQVKFEFTLNSDTTFTSKLLNKLHQPITEDGFIKNSNLNGLNYRKYNSEKRTSKSYEFVQLNDNICYLKLSSFNGYLFKELDSFYKANTKFIKSKPYLIIDIRNNGGGSDACYANLRQFFYTNPIKTDIVDIFATPDNIKVYEKNLVMMLADSANFGFDAIKEQRSQIKKMKKSKPYKFVNIETEHNIFLDSVTFYPKKVAIVFNRQSASTAEDLIFEVLQSKKVITIGENSGGYTGYGNVCDIEIPNSNLTLSYTTIRYRKQRKYDGIGFTPKIKVDTNKDIISIIQGIF